MQELIHAFGFDFRLLIVQMINFGLVLLVLWYFLYRPMMRMIDKRQTKIREGIENADRAEAEVKDAEKERNKILTDANSKAEKLYADGKEYADEKKSEILADAQTRSERTITEAEEKGQEIKEQLIKESQEEIAKMAVLSAEKILRERSGETAKADQ